MMRASPAPWDAKLGKRGLMLIRDAQTGGFAYKESSQPLPSQGDVPIVIDDWSRGIGVPRDRGVPETRGALHRSSAEADFGGFDGSYGPGMPGPEILSVAISGGHRIRVMALYGTTLYFAVDNLLYSSANHLGTDAVLAYTATGTITSLVVAQLQASLSLLWIAVKDGPYVTYDGATFQADATTIARTGNPQGVYRTTNGTDYLDFTAAVTDNNVATGMDVNSFSTTAGNKWVLVGFTQAWKALTVVVANTNGNAVNSVFEYWNGSTYAPLVISDGTVTASKTLAKSGKITFTRPSDWVPTVLNESAQTRRLWFVRWSFSGAVDASTSVSGLGVEFQEEANGFCVSSNVLWALYQDNRVMWTRTGGRKATWVKSANDLPAGGTYVGMASVQDTLYIKRTTDISAPDQSGNVVSYVDDLFGAPAEAEDGVVMSWLDELYFSHSYRLFKWSPVDGLASIGPERFSLSDSDAVQTRVTCGTFDRSHAAYFVGFNDVSGESFLFRYGVFRQTIDQATGTVGWTRSDVLQMIATLGARKFTSAAVHYSGDQPYLLLGDSNGTLYRATCPRGISPLDQNSGYKWSVVPAIADLPSFEGDDLAAKLVLYAASITARQLSSTTTISLYAKPRASTVWTLVGVNTVSGLRRLSFDEAVAGAGVDVRLVLRAGSNTNPPLLDTLTLHAQQDAQLREIVITLQARMDEQMQDNDGFLMDWSPEDYRRWLDRLLDESLPQTFISPFGQKILAKVRSYEQSIGQATERRATGRVLNLTLAKAS